MGGSDCLKTEIRILRGLEGRLSLEISNVLFTGVFRSKNEDFVYFASKNCVAGSFQEANS